MSLTTTTDATFATDVLDSPGPVLVEFTADWCPPCHRLAPILDQIGTEQAERLRVVALDVDDNPETTLKYEILGMPTLALFIAGEVVTRFTGFRPKAAILRELEPHLAPVPTR